MAQEAVAHDGLKEGLVLRVGEPDREVMRRVGGRRPETANRLVSHRPPALDDVGHEKR